MNIIGLIIALFIIGVALAWFNMDIPLNKYLKITITVIIGIAVFFWVLSVLNIYQLIK